MKAKLLLASLLCTSYAAADTPPAYPTDHLAPKFVRCDGVLIELPAYVLLPISCEDARAYRDGNEAAAGWSQCEAQLEKVKDCYGKYKTKKKREACLKR